MKSDSITYGFQSTSGNGYREQLFTRLAASGNTGNKVDFIGSVNAGSMPDNNNEGHNGATIDQISSFATSSLQQRPNIVLIHAGTNDLNGNVDPSGAPQRLGALIDKVVAACPDALVLVAQIVRSSNAATNSRVLTFNKAIPGIVAARQTLGKHVMVVDMYSQVPSNDFADSLHPNNAGYSVMGDVWYRAIAYASAQMSWLGDPKPGTGGSKVLCPNAQPNWIPQGTIANGAGLGKNRYPSIICKD
jgi:lysophospholipase L1-like esterase